MTPPSGQLWPEVLNHLQSQLSTATFDAWLRGSRAYRTNGHIEIEVANPFAMDWLENRLRPTIEAAVAHIAGEPLQVEFRLARAEAEGEQLPLILQGVREDEYTIVVKPDVVFVGTQYFRQTWLPVLGPTLWVLILELRQRCYWSKNGEKRDKCKATYAELAASVGISESTAKRSLQPGPAVDLFIVHREIIRRYSSVQGKVVSEATLWHVKLDEPILTDDLQVKLTRPSSPTGQFDTSIHGSN